MGLVNKKVNDKIIYRYKIPKNIEFFSHGFSIKITIIMDNI